MGVDENSLDIFDIGVVLECSLVESFLFTKGSYFGFVVKFPYFHLEDTFGNLRSNHDINFKNLSLIAGIFGFILPHAVEEERCKLLDSVSL